MLPKSTHIAFLSQTYASNTLESLDVLSIVSKPKKASMLKNSNIHLQEKSQRVIRGLASFHDRSCHNTIPRGGGSSPAGQALA